MKSLLFAAAATLALPVAAQAAPPMNHGWHQPAVRNDMRDPRTRIDRIQLRINRARHNGRLDRREAMMASRELGRIRFRVHRLERRDGYHLTAMDRDRLNQRLDALNQRLRWERND